MTVRSNISKKTEKILEHREHFINKIKSLVGTSSKEENTENVRFFVYPLLFYNYILECTKLHFCVHYMKICQIYIIRPC